MFRFVSVLVKHVAYKTCYTLRPLSHTRVCSILDQRLRYRDHFHKWWPLLHSFVFMIIRPTALMLKQKLFWNVLVVARLVRLIRIKTNEFFIWTPLWKRYQNSPGERSLVSLTDVSTTRWAEVILSVTLTLRMTSAQVVETSVNRD